MDELRHDTLYVGDQIRIKAQLQDARAAGLPGQLRVDPLRMTSRQAHWACRRARVCRAPAAPTLMQQHALADNRDTITHRGCCLVGRFPVQTNVVDLHDFAALAVKVIEIGFLVQVAACEEDVA